MAFKMNPKSPLLMKAMGVSPAKNMNKGYGPAETSSPAKQRLGDLAGGAAGKAARALQEGMEESAQNILPSVQEVKPVKKKKGIREEKKRGIKEETRNARKISEALRPERGMKKELRRIKKKKPSIIESEPIKKANAEKTKVKNKVEKKELTAKQKALQKLREAQGDNEVANIEKETSKVKKNSTKKRKQAKRKDSQAERRTEKTKRLEERIERRKARRSPAKQSKKADKSVFGPDGKNVVKPPKNQKKSKYDILFEDIANKAKKKKTSPAKQTAKQKANLPKEIVNAIAAKSPAKEVDKAGQRIIKQGEKAEAAYKAGNVKKGNRHRVRAKRMGGRYDAKMLKNNLKGGLRNNNAQG